MIRATKTARQVEAMAVWLFVVVFAPMWLYGQTPSAGKAVSPATSPQSLDLQLLEGLNDVPAPSGAGSREGPPSAADTNSAVLSGAATDGSDGSRRHPLVPIRDAMRHAEQLLVAGDVSKVTQGTQQQILVQLDSLIESLAAAQTSQSQQRQSAVPETSSQQQAGKESSSGDGGKPNETDVTVLPAVEFRQAFGEYWGHLPERVRRRLQSTEAMEFLPRYRDIIEDYYKRMSQDPALR